jgi:hypothetical protein
MREEQGEIHASPCTQTMEAAGLGRFGVWFTTTFGQEPTGNRYPRRDRLEPGREKWRQYISLA